MKRYWVLLSIIVVLLASAACGPIGAPLAPGAEDSPSPQSGDKLVYGLSLAPSGIDPHVNASSELGIALTSVYDTLIFRDPAPSGDDSLFVPGLAESWEISPDELTYTFHLRRGVTFHDDQPFNADAVRANIERVLDPDTMSQKAIFLLGPVSSVEVIDDYTVAIHLSSPYAPLLDGLAQVYLGMASPDALARWGADYQFHQVGTGPFKYVEYVPNDHLTIARNDLYAWGPDIYDHPGPAYLDEVEFRFFTDPAGRVVALEAGDVDVMGEIPPLDAARLDQQEGFSIFPVAVPGQSLGLILNTRRPPLDDPVVRQALLLATDRDSIVQAVFSTYSPVAFGPLTAATFGYAAVPAEQYAFQPSKARSLLDSAGWTDSDDDGIREKDGQPLALDAVLMTWGLVPEVAQLLQSQWLDVGVKLDLRTLTYPAAVEAASQSDYHLIPQAYSGSDPDILWTYYHSGNPFNWSQESDATLDDLLDRARSVTDTDQRSLLYADAQARIMELALLVPFRDPVNLNGTNDHVQGLRFDAHGWFPLLHDVRLE